ncbi:MAG TPA: biotin transporter BioY [Actinospica sp.]|jgi:biotin transport system substrate-specific component|nr:biotin transporter BioY [Actinospica sp.]
MTALTHSPNAPRLVLADLVPGTRLRDAALVLAGAGLTGLAAQIEIHTFLTPVPFTLQTLAALLVGASLGTVRGSVSMLVYALAGASGIPWFAGHTHGWSAPSFGYILGFVAAAALVGALAERGRDRDPISAVGTLALGSAVVYVVGTLWLAIDLRLTAAKAIELGITPFLLTDALKIAAAALALPALWRALRR